MRANHRIGMRHRSGIPYGRARPVLPGPMPLMLGLIALVTFAARFEVQARPNTGIQAIGLSAWEGKSVDALATEIKASPYDVEVACLPFNFKPRAPFAQVNRLIGKVLDDSGFLQSLTVTIYLSFHRDEFIAQVQGNGKKAKYVEIGKGRWKGKIQWSSFNDKDWASFTKKVGRHKFLREYDRRLGELLTWIPGMETQLASGRLKIIVCPSLEDECSETDMQAYLNLVRWTRVRGVNLRMRRSSLFRNAWRVPGMPLEVHGDPAELKLAGKLANEDWISNDGCDVRVGSEKNGGCAEENSNAAARDRPTLDEYLKDLDNLRSKVPVTFLLWRAAYNTNDGSRIAPRSRRKLTPFTGEDSNEAKSIQTGANELGAVRAVLGR